MTASFKKMFGIFCAIFVVGACVTLPLAINLILYSIDPSTHFYYDNAKLVPVTNAILIILTIALIVPAFLKKSGSVKSVTVGRKPIIAVFSAILGLALALSSAYGIMQTFTSRAGVGSFLTGLTGFLAAIYFFVNAEKFFTGHDADMRMLALLPVLWGVVNLMSTFMGLTQIANISEYIYEILQMVFAILFLYYNARLLGGVPNKREVNGVFAYGLPCALYGLLASLPHIIAHMIKSGVGSLPKPSDAVYLAMAVYVIVLLASLITSKPVLSQDSPAAK